MYKERRKALASALPDTAIALVCSGKAPYKVGDEKYDFSVDRSFYYLTGLDKENMVLAIIKVEGRVSAVSYTHLPTKNSCRSLKKIGL